MEEAQMRNNWLTSRHGRSAVPLAALAAGVLVTAACGSTTSTSSSAGSSSAAAAVTAAMAIVQQSESPLTFTAPGPPVDNAKVRGAVVGYVPIADGIPFTTSVYKGFHEAMQATGVTDVYFGTMGTPATWAQAVQQAISRGVKVIALQGIPVAAISSAITAANQANIPVVETNDLPLSSPLSTGVAAQVQVDYHKIGMMEGAYAIVHSHAQVKAVLIEIAGDESASDPIAQGAIDIFSQLCPQTCTYTKEKVAIPDWATKLPSLTSTALADPNVNYLIPTADGMATYMVPAVHQAGAQSRATILSFNATPGLMKYLSSNDVLLGDVGSPLLWAGYEIADQTLRLLAGATPLPTTAENVPLELFTKDNFTVSEINNDEWTWYGTPTFIAGYKQLWGVS
jgi:ribose transport system substrate-binding protein